MAKPLIIQFDKWTLHRESGELERDGARVRLHDLPLQILDELLSRPGQLVTREQLIARLWPKTVVDYDTNLNSSVRRLRVALQDNADAPRYIETLPRKGYRYVGPQPQPVDAAPAATARPRAWAALVVAAIATVCVGVTTYMLWSGPRAVAPDRQARLRLAVLPFENLSPDPANAFFTDGIHEELLSTIATRAPHLDVISRTTMRAYRDARSVHDVARELSVTHVLAGSVRREGQSVRLTLQLIDARSDIHLWSRNFDRRLVETLALQSEVAEDVASQLAVKLAGRIGELPTSMNPQAYDLYLKSRQSMRVVAAARSAQELNEAEEPLSRAIELDPRFGAAFLERARVRLSRFTSSQDTSETNLRALSDDLSAARRLMGDAPPLLVTEAQYAALVDFNSAKALTLLNAARALNPNSSEVAQVLGRQLSSVGKPREALAQYERAADLDPANPAVFADWAATLKMARMPEESLRVSRDFDARYPGRTTYGWRLFGFTGELHRAARELTGTQNEEARLAAEFDLLRFSNRIAELAELIERSGLSTIPQASFGGFAVPAIGRKPVAELHGWAKLLENDTAAAARDGRVILNFVAQQPVTKWNAWYLRMLTAEGELFSGNRAKAAEHARVALDMAPRNVHVGVQRYAPALAARILAWAGAEDEAVGLLVRMSSNFPTIGPAEILRDPLYTIPLGRNPRFGSLARRLNVELAANQQFRDQAHLASIGVSASHPAPHSSPID
jgi:TolB-like protein/DNA-binding winged helix-turn-helix (wHTH) protein